MNIKIIKLDINKPIYEKIQAKQGDTKSRYLLFHLLDEAIPFSLNGRTVRVYGLKPDNKEIFNDLQIVDATRGICKLELTSQALAVPGNLDLELVIMEGESKLSSIPFVVEVLKSLNSKSAIESSNEYKALDRSLTKVEEWNNEFADKSGKLEQLYTERLNGIDSHLADIANDINSLFFYPRLIGETNDYNRFLRAINATKVGGTLKVPIGNYDLGGNDIKITKSIKIIGDGYLSTNIGSGGFSIEASNCEISNLFINCPSLDNGIQVNQARVNNILISNCKTKARDHGYLIESYNGVVQDVRIINCLSIDSIHGFISKAIGTKFINCKANNHTGFAFGFISDNIPSIDKVANSQSNTILNCECDSCGTGFFSYCRDKWNSVCTPRVSNNSVDGLVISNTQNPFAVGEETTPQDYLSIYRIDFMTINNVKVINPKQSVWAMSLRNNYRCIVDNCILPCAFEQKATSQETLVGNVIIETGRPHTLPQNISTIKPLDTSINTSFDILLDSVSTNKIKLSQLPKNGNAVTVIVRSTGSSNTYGGFDTTNIITNDASIPTQFAFNHGQILQFVWSVSIKKWVLISASADIAF